MLPTIAVDDRLTLKSGARTIDIRYLGSGHTAADLVVYLPEDGILMSGDLVAWPVPLVGDPQSHIGAWSRTLDSIRALHPSIIVPGHGPVLRNDQYLATLSRMFASISEQATAMVKRGGSLDEALATVNLDRFRAEIAGDSAVRQLLFATYVARPAVSAAWREASR